MVFFLTVVGSKFILLDFCSLLIYSHSFFSQLCRLEIECGRTRLELRQLCCLLDFSAALVPTFSFGSFSPFCSVFSPAASFFWPDLLLLSSFSTPVRGTQQSIGEEFPVFNLSPPSSCVHRKTFGRGIDSTEGYFSSDAAFPLFIFIRRGKNIPR